MEYSSELNELVRSGAGIASGFAIGALILALIMFLLALGIIIFEAIALSKFFEKAGKPKWAAWLILIPVVGYIYPYLLLLDIAGYKWYYVFALALGGIPVIGWLISLLFAMTMGIKLAKSFGQSTGYGIGLCLLGWIFMPIMAFDKNVKYVGPAVNGDIDFNDLF